MTTIEIPALAEGETYGGFIGGIDGNGHHIILLPGDNDEADWKTQMAWAESIGGDLPSKAEQALLLLNVPDQFMHDVYWSNQTCAYDGVYVWNQSFLSGNQYDGHKNVKIRARAIRRVWI